MSNYPEQLDARVGMGVGMGGGMIGTGVDPRGMQQAQANTINKPPRLEAAANRLEALVAQFEKTLGSAHSHVDRIAGQQGLERIEKTPGAYGPGTSPPAGSVIARLEQSLDRMAGLTASLAGSLHERLSAL